MRDPDLSLELRNAAALSRAEARSLTPPDECAPGACVCDAPWRHHNVFAPPLPEEGL